MPVFTSRRVTAGAFLFAPPAATSVARLRQDMRAARQYLSRFEPPPVGPYRFGDPSLPPLTLLVVGDSSGLGVGCQLAESLPWRVATELAAEYQVTMRLRGRSGDRSEHLPAQLQAATNDPADIVLVCAGSNDATHMLKFWLSPAQVEANFREAVQLINLRWPHAAVILTGAADMGSLTLLGHTLAGRGLRRRLGRCARLVNARVKRVAAEYGVTYVPLARLVTREFRRNPACFAEDGFHPSGYGYEVLYQKIMPTVWQVVRYRWPEP
jgi:lysophospholipase L1-like esterase